MSTTLRTFNRYNIDNISQSVVRSPCEDRKALQVYYMNGRHVRLEVNHDVIEDQPKNRNTKLLVPQVVNYPGMDACLMT